ncbi:MAG: FliI/YscN family ATPase, partial [Proteobacteria bacterium]|nr:FliI/YscN family ATPase [Pseudomonadota bacterium]
SGLVGNNQMNLEQFCKQIRDESFVTFCGRVTKVRRDSVRVFVPNAKVGSVVMVQGRQKEIPLEIVSLDPEGHVAMPLDELNSVQLGDLVTLREEQAVIPVGKELLGQVVDSLCRPLETNRKLNLPDSISLYGEYLNPMDRTIIREPIDLGVRTINALLTCGLGQRAGIFAGSGVGKSVLLGMMARFTSADVVVVGLIGERGKEVREFIEHELGEEGRKKSVTVVETAEKSPVRRVRGAYVSTAIAEYFRKQGLQVLLLMDSLTRFAMAQREIGMAAGEPPTSKGYTPSVFSGISRLVERAGNFGAEGSITGLYTVLVEGDDLEDPVADSARSILDGHLVLSRKIANKGQYPAIDILQSVSRVMDQVTEKTHSTSARRVKQILARFQDNEDAINLGLYNRGSDQTIDEAIEKEPIILDFLKQGRDEHSSFFDSKSKLLEIAR